MFQQQRPGPQAVNEFGVVRWAPNAADFMRDQIAYFERRGMNHAIWVWEPSWEPWRSVGDKAMNYLLGPDPNNFEEVENDLLRVILDSWAHNIVRPSQYLTWRNYLPLVLRRPTALVFTPSTADILNSERSAHQGVALEETTLVGYAERDHTLAGTEAADLNAAPIRFSNEAVWDGEPS
jgi:hypothetical protein